MALGFGAIAELPLATSSVSASFNLVGVSATGAVGLFTPEVDFTLSGVSATGAVGSFTAQVGPSLTGVAATAAVGSFTPEVDFSLSGVSSTGAVGSFVPTSGPALTGVTATAHVGGFTVEIDFTLTGVSATGHAGSFTVTGDVTVSLTGVSATGQVGSFSVTESITISLTGVSAFGEVGEFTVTIFIPRPFAHQNIFAFTIPGSAVKSAAGIMLPAKPQLWALPNLPSALFISVQKETETLELPIRLMITRPDGSVYTNNGLYTYAATVQGANYVVYNTDNNELNQRGWWLVDWFAGPFTSAQSAFYVN